jgi:hypothetical protein
MASRATKCKGYRTSLQVLPLAQMMNMLSRRYEAINEGVRQGLPLLLAIFIKCIYKHIVYTDYVYRPIFTRSWKKVEANREQIWN